jgi:hypothetical protein
MANFFIVISLCLIARNVNRVSRIAFRHHRIKLRTGFNDPACPWPIP